VIGLYPDAETTELVDAWLDAHPDAPAALRRLVSEQRDHQRRAIRVRRAQESLVG
jgi:aminopeptidase N